MSESFFIFGHLGLGDHICCNSLYRHFSKLHEKIIIVCYEHNLAAIQWMLSDTNIYFYPVETEAQLLTCRNSIRIEDRLCLGFYNTGEVIENYEDLVRMIHIKPNDFNPIKWDSEFYRQAGLDFELSYSGFRLPEFDNGEGRLKFTEGYIASVHEDRERGFEITKCIDRPKFALSKNLSLKQSCHLLYSSHEIHVIDSSMLCLADRLETPYCKRFVFHRYARKGLPPSLKKSWEIID